MTCAPIKNRLSSEKSLLRALRIGTCLCFAGWAWQYLRWDASYGAVLWNPVYMGFVAAMLQYDWEIFIATILTDNRILILTRVIGGIYLFLAMLVWFGPEEKSCHRICHRIWRGMSEGGLLLGSAVLAIGAFCAYVASGHQLAMFVEYGCQIFMPLILIFSLRRGVYNRVPLVLAVIAFWATFGGHGAYALGLVTTPGHYFGMVHAIFGTSETITLYLLRAAGIADFMICIGILIPQIRRLSLLYGIAWGALTALARPVAGMSFSSPWWQADQFLHEALLRAPHVIIPYYLYRVLVVRKMIGGSP
jgi:hypothetical protein